MPIQKLTVSSLEQFCGSCSQVNEIQLSILDLGISAEAGATTNKDIIRLPVCPGCGSTENVVRTWDDATGAFPPGHQFEHRKVVNRLAKMLKVLGQVNPDCAAEINAETDDPPNIHPTIPADPSPSIDIGPPAWASSGEGG